MILINPPSPHRLPPLSDLKDSIFGKCPQYILFAKPVFCVKLSQITSTFYQKKSDFVFI